MTPHHFFVDFLEYRMFDVGDRVSLSQDDSHHALRSLRLQLGEEVTIANNVGRVGHGRLIGAKDGVATIEIDSVEVVDSPTPQVAVAMAAPKGDRLSWATQKLGELGVDQLMILSTARSTKSSLERARATLVRQAEVARQAAMQSRRPFVMHVSTWAFSELAGAAQHLKLLLSTSAHAGLSESFAADPKSILLAVGPEGDFTPEEVQEARAAGFADVSLGAGILRTETAAIVGAALVLARYGRLG